MVGLSFTNSIVRPKRLKGTTRKLAVVSEAINEEKQMIEKKRNNVDNAVENGGRLVKHEVTHKKKDSKKIKHPHPSSSGAKSMHTSQKEHSKHSEWTSVVAKKINVVDLHKHHHHEKYDQLPNLNVDYHWAKTHPPKDK